MIFTIEQVITQLNRPCFGGRQVTPKGQRCKQFRYLPSGRKPVWIALGIRQVFCLDCEVVRQTKIGFADARRI